MNESCHTHMDRQSKKTQRGGAPNRYVWISHNTNIWMSHDTHTHEWDTSHTHEWVMSHTYEWVMSCTYECVMSHTYEWFMSHTYEWVMSRVWMRRVSHMNASYLTSEWVMSHTCEWDMSHTYEWVMTHTYEWNMLHAYECVISYAGRRTKFAPVKSLDSSEFSSEFSDLKTLSRNVKVNPVISWNGHNSFHRIFPWNSQDFTTPQISFEFSGFYYTSNSFLVKPLHTNDRETRPFREIWSQRKGRGEDRMDSCGQSTTKYRTQII